MNLANVITFFRISLVPVFIIFFLAKGYINKLIALVIFIFAAISDYFDGKIARKHKIETNFGKFLDPLADKFLVLTALFLFTLLKEFYVPLWLVLLISIREILVTSLRIIAINRKISLKTSYVGKLKTVIQLISIIIIILLLILVEAEFIPITISLITKIPMALLVLASFITLYSGIDYIVKFIKAFKCE